MNQVDPLEVDVKYLEMIRNCDDSNQDRNEIEELCDNFLNIEGFKHLFDDQKLKEILEDLGMKAILDDSYLVKTLNKNNWKIHIEIEEEEPGKLEYDSKYEIVSENIQVLDTPSNKNQEIDEYLKLDIKEEQNKSEFDMKSPKISKNHVEVIDT